MMHNLHNCITLGEMLNILNNPDDSSQVLVMQGISITCRIA